MVLTEESAQKYNQVWPCIQLSLYEARSKHGFISCVHVLKVKYLLGAPWTRAFNNNIRWKIVYTWWTNKMLIWSSLAHWTAQRPLCKKENWKATSPSLLPTLRSESVSYNSGVPNNWGPPKRRPGQKNAYIEGKKNMLMILGKLWSYVYLDNQWVYL